MNRDLAFSPDYKTSIVLPTSTSAVSWEIGRGTCMVVSNTGAADVYIRMGNTDAAIGVGYLVLAGSQVALGKPEEETRLTFISSAVSAIHVITGRGI